MATIARLTGDIQISIHRRDHEPPHFHARCAGREVLIHIADLSIYRGELPPSAHRVVINWAERHQAELALSWIRARAGYEPADIEVP